MSTTESTGRKTPSKDKCQQIIRRILITELLENGKNRHFKAATDFLTYFESLYPASAALTKQVQRSVKAMDLPKDEQGYFIINKTHEQLEEDKSILHLLRLSQAKQVDLDQLTPVFIKIDNAYKEALMNLIGTSISFQGKYEVLLPAHNGLLFYTSKPKELQLTLNELFAKL